MAAGGAGAGAATVVAAGEGSSSVLTLVAGGSAEGAGGGPVGALIGIIGAVGTYDAIQGYKLGQAYDWWGQPKPNGKPNGAPSLAGRYSGGRPPNDNDDECKKEWDEAREFCAKELAKPNPNRSLTGGYHNIEDCARGHVSEHCGGNPKDWGNLR